MISAELQAAFDKAWKDNAQHQEHKGDSAYNAGLGDAIDTIRLAFEGETFYLASLADKALNILVNRHERYSNFSIQQMDIERLVGNGPKWQVVGDRHHQAFTTQEIVLGGLSKLEAEELVKLLVANEHG